MTLIQQQRLIGSILLLCIIAAVAYFLLSRVEDKPVVETKQEIIFDSSIKPINDDIEIVESNTETLVDPHHLEVKATEPPESIPVEKPVVQNPVSISEQKLPASATSVTEQRWVLQLGSFSVRDNAASLTSQLEKLGYSSYMETISSNGKSIYRVRLKPTSNRNELETIAKTLKDKLHLSPQILQFND